MLRVYAHLVEHHRYRAVWIVIQSFRATAQRSKQANYAIAIFRSPTHPSAYSAK
jgi:hypothetical protein